MREVVDEDVAVVIGEMKRKAIIRTVHVFIRQVEEREDCGKVGTIQAEFSLKNFLFSSLCAHSLQTPMIFPYRCSSH